MDLLLDLLNSRPLVDGVERDALRDPASARRWARLNSRSVRPRLRTWPTPLTTAWWMVESHASRPTVSAGRLVNADEDAIAREVARASAELASRV